ncbi:unnamed protein product [Coffea canephora]|uniref:Leucine-rich repeat-containing N-terminal plant-type domain-containing protein n=1 Tax=Coffea canephora TaxID=49390 RepID=A0A068US31_COFCA|nr:unnamed protein product [Coffea canephora]
MLSQFDISKWIGVCSKLKVASRIFPFLSLLNLEYPNLGVNQFFGGIPHQMGILSKLIYIDFSVNELSQEIRALISDNPLNKQAWNNLDSNFSSIPIPPEIGTTYGIVNVYLQYNNLIGPIPATFDNLDRLFLVLSQNYLAGSIPKSLGNLTNLMHLYLFDNQHSGSIPKNLGDLKFLVDMELGKNQLNMVPILF